MTLVNRDGFHNIRVRNYEADLTPVRVRLDDVLVPVGVQRVEGEVTGIDLAGQTAAMATASGKLTPRQPGSSALTSPAWLSMPSTWTLTTAGPGSTPISSRSPPARISRAVYGRRRGRGPDRHRSGYGNAVTCCHPGIGINTIARGGRVRTHTRTLIVSPDKAQLAQGTPRGRTALSRWRLAFCRSTPRPCGYSFACNSFAIGLIGPPMGRSQRI